jgi:hypothetical protein
VGKVFSSDQEQLLTPSYAFASGKERLVLHGAVDPNWQFREMSGC